MPPRSAPRRLPAPLRPDGGRQGSGGTAPAPSPPPPAFARRHGAEGTVWGRCGDRRREGEVEVWR